MKIKTIEEIRQSLDKEPSGGEVMAYVLQLRWALEKLTGTTVEEILEAGPSVQAPSAPPAPPIPVAPPAPPVILQLVPQPPLPNPS